VVAQLADLVSRASGGSIAVDHIWVLLTEAAVGGWGLAGHASTNDELVTAARAEIAQLQAKAAQV
jgi:hypothetical protein